MASANASQDDLVLLAEDVAARLDAGETEESIDQRLETQFGFSGEAAVGFVEHIAEARCIHIRQTGIRELLWGVGLCATGGGITYATYLLTNPGGYYFVMYGLVIWGIIKVCKGLYKLAK